jgi:hypothetical protein
MAILTPNSGLRMLAFDLLQESIAKPEYHHIPHITLIINNIPRHLLNMIRHLTMTKTMKEVIAFGEAQRDTKSNRLTEKRC